MGSDAFQIRQPSESWSASQPSGTADILRVEGTDGQEEVLSVQSFGQPS
jgi:hypothetical protein